MFIIVVLYTYIAIKKHRCSSSPALFYDMSFSTRYTCLWFVCEPLIMLGLSLATFVRAGLPIPLHDLGVKEYCLIYN
nr:MAG TPA: hypothetical protein [Caudoviricetes sp.]